MNSNTSPLFRWWLWMLVVMFILKGIVIASVMTPWAGEDEPSHFGYIEGLDREGVWFLFEENLASLEMRMAHRWWDVADDKDEVINLFSGTATDMYREYASDHLNATAYQPPLYYWVMSQVYGSLRKLDIFSVLYIVRYMNVFLGAAYIGVVYLITKELTDNTMIRMMMLAFVGWLPMLGLMSGTVTVQVSVLLGYGLLLYVLLASNGKRLFYLAAVLLTILGLLMQQAFLAAPALVVLSILFDLVNKRLSLGRSVGLLLLLALCMAVIFPQWQRRHALTRYTETGEERLVHRGNVLLYLPLEFERLRTEQIDSFWDQRRSMIPYYASEKLERAMKIVVVMAAFGLVGLAVRRRDRWLADQRNRRVLWVISLMLVLFVAGHLWFDYVHFLYSGQVYYKARYIYPILPVITVGFSYGLSNLAGNERLRFLYLATILLLVGMEASAISWLMIQLSGV